MILQESYTLSNGVQIPKLGLGTWLIPDNEATAAVKAAIDLGYRHIDSAQAYGNERGVGEGVRAAKKCDKYGNACFEFADIMHLDYADGQFDKVIAANVIHLLDEPLKALAALDRVCKPGGQIIIPTYINREKGKGEESGISKLIGKAGADFKRHY